MVSCHLNVGVGQMRVLEEGSVVKSSGHPYLAPEPTERQSHHRKSLRTNREAYSDRVTASE